MIVKAIIINIEKINNVNMVSVLFCEKEDDNSDFQYTLQIVTEDSVIDALKAGRVTLDNAKVDGGKLKGITGDLKRFAGEHKPVVILAEMHQEKQGLIGYRVSLSNGTVRRVKLKEMLAYAKRKTDANQIPFQNGIYVRETGEKKEDVFLFPDKQEKRQAQKKKPVSDENKPRSFQSCVRKQAEGKPQNKGEKKSQKITIPA